MKQFSLFASVATGSSSSQCDGFAGNDLMFCSGLTKHPNVTHSEACKELCCDDPTCDTWQFCPTSAAGCNGWAGSRCWFGNAGSFSSCQAKTHWIGGSKLAPAPQPSPEPTPSPSPSPKPSPTPSPTPLPVMRKRGLGGYVGKNYECNDGELLHMDDSWHYSWIANPSQYGKCNGQTISAEFVPMVNGIGQAKNMATNHFKTTWTNLNVRFLLGYNEPDYGNGHNHPHQATPADAAADWPALQEVALMFDPPLELVAPGVASGSETGGSDAWDANGHSTWLDEFLGNCTDVVKACDPSMIKYVAMHDYWGHVSMLDKRLSGAVERYGRKVWLTEFAITDWRDPPTREMQDAYMREVLPFLDSNDNVFRYAWFSSRNCPDNQNAGSNLLECDGTPKLTSTGRIYAGLDSSIMI